MLLLEDKRYYVYVYMDPTKKGTFQYGPFSFEYEPFYVGKGFKTRYIDHLKLIKCESCISFFYKKLKKMLKNEIIPIIIKYKENLNEVDAYNLEDIMVATIGKRIDQKGPLTNVNNGGGRKPVKFHDKISRTSKELWQDEEYKEKVLKAKNNNWKIIFPNEEIVIIRNLKQWCKENNFIYSSCLKYNTRRIKYNGYCFINLHYDGDLTSNNFREEIKYSERRYKRNIYKIIKINGEELIICDIKEFCKLNKISHTTFRNLVNTNIFYKNLFKVEMLKQKINICNKNVPQIQEIKDFYKNSLTLTEVSSVINLPKNFIKRMSRTGLQKDRIDKDYRIFKQDVENLKKFLKTHKFQYQIAKELNIHNFKFYRLEKAGIITSTSLYGQKAFDLENYTKIKFIFKN
jgi:hypothetical protein